MSFSGFGLSPAIEKGVAACGFTVPTPIQEAAVPPALLGRDIIGCAPTGTGKTAAFVLPVLNRLSQSPRPSRPAPRALILTPTRELAQQIDTAARKYGKFSGLRSLSVYGGVNINPQMQELRRGTDIVVATPGRLLDLTERNALVFSHIEVLVLDEADRMFDMGFIRDVRKIVGLIPRTRQTLLFSATMSPDIRSLIAEVQHNPECVEIGSTGTPAETVDQHFFQVERHAKLDLLVHILENEGVETMLVFSRTKHGADKISRKLAAKGISAAAIHANRSQLQRRQALDGFKRRMFKVLVATDLAARGIDVERISHVVNFDTPAFAEDYVHRIGRTGRAESKGTALTFVDGEERQYVRKIEHLTRRRFEVKAYPGFTPTKAPVAFEPTHSRKNFRFSRSGKPQRIHRYA